MNLATGKVITRNKIWERPVTDLVIKAVETIANEQGIGNLKITGRNKIPIYPADWIAGVEYEENRPDETDTDDKEEQYEPENEDIEREEFTDDYDKEYDKIQQDKIDELFADDERDENESDDNENAEAQESEDDETQEDEEVEMNPTQEELEQEEDHQAALRR